MSIELMMTPNHFILCHPLLLLPSIFPSIRVFPNGQVFTSGSRTIWASASISVLPMNIQNWFPLELTGLICLQSKGLLRVFSSNKIWKNHFLGTQIFLWSNSHIHTWLLKKYRFDYICWHFFGKVMSLLFNMLSRFVIAVLPRSKCLLISWLQSPSAVILEPKKIKFVTFHCFPISLPWSDGTGWHDLRFLNVEF